MNNKTKLGICIGFAVFGLAMPPYGTAIGIIANEVLMLAAVCAGFLLGKEFADEQRSKD